MIKKSIFFRIINRICIFLFLFLCVLCYLYISGNAKKFLDSTLNFILLGGSVVSIVLLVLSVFTFVLAIILFFLQKKYVYLMYLPFLFLYALVSFFMMFISQSIGFVTSGL